MRGTIHYMMKNYAKAIEDSRSAIQADAKNPGGYSQLAVILATCPEDKYRNGKEALEAAHVAMKMRANSYNSAALAVAYAEVQDFDNAVRCQKEALLDAEYVAFQGATGRRRLEHYEKKQTYYED